MKSLTFNFRVALSALLCALAVTTTASAQEEAAASWVKVAPPNEAFTVSMPRMPSPVATQSSSAELSVAGRRYSLSHNDAEYTVWSFRGTNLPASGGDWEAYLDRCAEIAWHLLIDPYWKKLKEVSPQELMKYNLTYDGKLPLPRDFDRSYRLQLGERSGITHIYVADSQIYIVAAAAAARETASVEKFIKSFTLNLPVPESPVSVPTGTGGGRGIGTGADVGVGPGRGGVGSGEAPGGANDDKAKETDYNRTFAAREVTQRARILVKPEPNYTEWARKFGVTGAVRVRVILTTSGEVKEAVAVKRLPHGLTQEAIKAAQKIKFEPAVKDGRPVSQYVVIEYNFNIY